MARPGKEHLLLPTAACLALVVFCAAVFIRVNFCTPAFWISKGVSMQPTIHAGDFEFAGHESYAALRIGEIVIYRPAGNWTTAEYVCHRIVAGWPGHWVTQGDNNRQPDPGYLTPQNYVATVELILRHGEAFFVCQ